MLSGGSDAVEKQVRESLNTHIAFNSVDVQSSWFWGLIRPNKKHLGELDRVCVWIQKEVWAEKSSVFGTQVS